MAASRRKKVDLPRPELNITAMMDLVLNLITFFVLVANFAVASMPGLEPPDPEKSAAKVEENPNRIIVSVIAHPDFKGRAGGMVVGDRKIVEGDLEGLATVLENEVRISSSVNVYLRADKSIRYDEIEPIMLAIAGTGVSSFHMVAVAAD